MLHRRRILHFRIHADDLWRPGSAHQHSRTLLFVEAKKRRRTLRKSLLSKRKSSRRVIREESNFRRRSTITPSGRRSGNESVRMHYWSRGGSRQWRPREGSPADSIIENMLSYITCGEITHFFTSFNPKVEYDRTHSFKPIWIPAFPAFPAFPTRKAFL